MSWIAKIKSVQGYLLPCYAVHRRRAGVSQGMSQFSTIDLFEEMSGDTDAEMEKNTASS